MSDESDKQVTVLLCDKCHAAQSFGDLWIHKLVEYERRVRRATGFNEFAEEFRVRYCVPIEAATKSASIIWGYQNEAFRAPYRLTALLKLKSQIPIMLDSVDRMIKNQREYIRWNTPDNKEPFTL